MTESRLKRFGQALGQTFKNIGTSAEKVLSKLDDKENPAIKKMDEDMEKALHGIE